VSEAASDRNIASAFVVRKLLRNAVVKQFYCLFSYLIRRILYEGEPFVLNALTLELRDAHVLNIPSSFENLRKLIQCQVMGEVLHIDGASINLLLVHICFFEGNAAFESKLALGQLEHLGLANSLLDCMQAHSIILSASEEPLDSVESKEYFKGNLGVILKLAK
jgi:hypothetical protein